MLSLRVRGLRFDGLLCSLLSLVSALLPAWSFGVTPDVCFGWLDGLCCC